jgi:hypothetical protein
MAASSRSLSPAFADRILSAKDTPEASIVFIFFRICCLGR